MCIRDRDEKALPVLRHTASHVMAQAVKRLYPGVKLAIGPSIADGFYYDMEFETPLTSDDFEKIEAEMKKIIKENLEIVRFTKPRDEAIAFMKEKGEPYKVEPVSYTHLDVYKRQSQNQMPATMESPLRKRQVPRLL